MTLFKNISEKDRVELLIHGYILQINVRL